MRIITKIFGEVEIDENRIFNFVLPIIGFDNLEKFIILDPNKENLFKWLQSTEDPALAFPIISVSAFDFDYTIDLPDNVVEILNITSVESLLIMNITSIPQDDPKGTELKNSLDSLKSSAAKAHTELVASKDELFNSIQSILTKING